MAAKKRSTGPGGRKRSAGGRPGPREPEAADASPAPDGAEGNGAPSERAAAVVVGVGSSAGGLAAFREFLSAMPADTAMAFVLVQHLDPSHRSQTAEILGRHAPLPVVEAEDGMPLVGGRAYVSPPGKYPSVADGRLRVTDPPAQRGLRMPINHLLRSVADACGDRAVGVILSGSGNDGTLGLMQVKARGGLALAQDPETAQFDGMPRSAIATGVVDCVVPIAEMSRVLTEFVHYDTVNCRTEDADGGPDSDADVEGVLAAVETATGYEFRRYKRPTLSRRIQRRMSLNRIDELARYAQLVRENPEEARRLLKDLLIGVTHFFREPAAWQALRESVLPDLIGGKPEGVPLRVWVAGCATGEEAYSVAMLLTEEVDAGGGHRPVQVFATDIDPESLEFARAGLYPADIAEDVSAERLARFFTREGDRWRVNPDLRERVVFAQQNLITDPPFSRLDLVSCRNLLIYIEQEAQRRIVSLFHFALNPGGCLLLGPSETVGPGEDVFEPVVPRWKIYRKVGTTRREGLEFPFLTPEAAAAGRKPLPRRSPPREQGAFDFAQQLLFERFVPASVLVDSACRALYFFGPTQNYLTQPPGERTDDLIALAADGLRSKLRAVLHQVKSTGQPAVVGGARVRRGGKSASVRLTATPVARDADDAGLLLVTFEEEEHGPPPAAGEAAAESESVVRQLEAELETTREELRGSVEEMDAWNEELRASNEEIMSMNEELQSTNEELEASKEELQSLNEELTTVNQQLLDKVRELEDTTNDLRNLLTSTHIATLFLDTELRIRRFTPDAARLFPGARPVVGRFFEEYAGAFPDEGLAGEARRVLETLESSRRQVRAGGDWFIRRVLPYRTHDNRIGGVVVTFTDVTELRQAHQAVLESEQRFRAMSDCAPVLIWTSGADARRDWFNKPWLDFTGRTAEQEHGDGWAQGVHPEDVDRCVRTYHSAFHARREFRMEYRLRRADGEYRWVLDRGLPRLGPEGTFLGYIGSCVDVTDRRQMEGWVRASEERYRTLVSATTSIVWTTDATGAFVERQASWEAYTGQPWEQHQGWGWAEMLHPDDRERLRREWAAALAGRSIYDTSGLLWSAAHGEHRHFLVRGAPVVNDDGTVREWVGTITDVHERVEAEAARRESERQLRLIAESLPVLISYVDAEGRYRFANAAYERWFGMRVEDIVGRHMREVLGDVAFGEIEEHVRAAMGGRSTAYERELHYARGGARYVRVEYVPDVAEDGAVRGFYALVTDASDRRRAERDRARLAALVESSDDAIIGKGLDRTIVSWNAAAERIYGYSAAEAIGRSIDVLIPEGRKAELSQIYDGVARGERLIQYETVRIRKDGRPIDVSLTISPILGAAGEIIGVSGIERDITERKRIESELIALNEHLEEKVARRTAEVEERAEQLRALATELTGAEQRERRRIAETLHDHVQQLMVAAKMRGAMTRHKTADESARQALVEMDDLIGQSIEACRSLAVDLSPPVLYDAGLQAALEWLARQMPKTYGLLVEIDAKPGLRLPSESLCVFLFQAIRELLFNIVKHGDTSEALIELSVEGEDRFCVLVADEGQGFDPGAVAVAQKSGEGFGLFGIRERLEQLGGEMQLDSAPGRGTRIRLIAPADTPRPGPLAKETAASHAAAPSQPLAEERPWGAETDRVRVVLADDHRIIREGIARLLREQPGIEVVGEAADGQAAVELVRKLRPDVVVMDITMPRVNGIEATRHIKREFPHTAVIGLSMHEHEDMAKAMRNAGAAAYLPKGGPSEELCRAIRAAGGRG